MRDLVIIGGGPAGTAASIYGARKRMDFVVVSPEVGGQAIWAPQVENYLGFQMISGADLVEKFEEHVKKYGVQVIRERAASIEQREKGFLTRLESGEELSSRAVVVCTGRSARNLGVPGEEEFMGKGVAYCATCDAPLFAGEDVAVAGGGNAGLGAAEQLMKVANKVYVIEPASKLMGDGMLSDKVRSAPNVEILTGTSITAISGTKMVEGITVRDSSGERKIPVTGVFVEIGSKPNSDFLPKEVALNEVGEVEVDCMNRTSTPGLFAAGDVTNVPHKQILIAAGEGAKALLSAYEYVIHTRP
ncbi:MAG: NAD(P)/FAD-dependent oxidoreductase [Armatimonadota bacterium]